MEGIGSNSEVNISQADYELQGLPWLTDYHILRNKRYVITNNSQGIPQIWNMETGKLIKTYRSKSFAQAKKMIADKYDLKDDQTPFPYSWFSLDLKLGCLTIHLDEETWHKCQVSDLQTNVQLLIQTPLMD